QNAQLELLQHRSGVDPELLGEQPTPALEHLQRVGLPAAAIQRKHQLATQPLAERVLGDERLQLRDQLVMSAERQVGLDPIADRRQPELLQPRDLTLGERLTPEIGQRLAVPERERIAQTRRALARVITCASLRDE